MHPSPSSPKGSRSALLILALLASSALGQGGPPPLPPPLPPVPVPPANPITEAKRVLGKILFWEEQLSSDNTVSCGTCHQPGSGGGDSRTAVHPGRDNQFGTPDDVIGSPGILRTLAGGAYDPVLPFTFNPQVTNRRTPDFTSSAFAPDVFWDGRARTTFVDPDTSAVLIPLGGALENQAIGPILSDVEMAHVGRSFTDATTKLATAKPLRLATNIPPDMAAAVAAHPTYPGLFQNAFGTNSITAARIAMAIATYERTLVANQTPFDQFAAGNPMALTPNQHQGFQLFNTQGRCKVCHQGPNFTDNSFRNLGLRPILEDNGRQAVTGNVADRGRFKVPGLRNAALRSRFFHNGQIQSLDVVMNFYAGGGGPFLDNKDPVLAQIALTPFQRTQVVDFLQALVDPRVRNETFPFDRPTLRSEVVPLNSNRFGPAQPGTGGVPPANLAGAPPFTGSAEMKLGVAGARNNSQAWLGISLGAAAPGTVLSGIPVNIDVPSALFVPVFLTGTGPLGGHATLQTPLPDDPNLVGIEIFTQWFVADPLAPMGVSASQGARYLIF